MNKILISGSSGLIGSALQRSLEKSYSLYRLVYQRAPKNEFEISWDPLSGILPKEKLENFYGVVHLGGESITGLWTKGKKKRILESRVKGTSLLSHTLASLKNPPEFFISASAIGYYGNRGDQPLTEESTPGSGFLAEVCQKWEEAALPAQDKGIRTLFLRTGIVLSPAGGILKNLIPLFKLCLGGKIGDGKQIMSWIHCDDLIRIIAFLMDHPTLIGPINAVAPHPISNAEFTRLLSTAVKRPAPFNVPSSFLQFALGDLANDLLLTSQNVIPLKLNQNGFFFTYPSAEKAIEQVTSS